MDSFLGLDPAPFGLSKELSSDIQLLYQVLGKVLREQEGEWIITSARKLVNDSTCTFESLDCAELQSAEGLRELGKAFAHCRCVRSVKPRLSPRIAPKRFGKVGSDFRKLRRKRDVFFVKFSQGSVDQPHLVSGDPSPRNLRQGGCHDRFGGQRGHCWRRRSGGNEPFKPRQPRRFRSSRDGLQEHLLKPCRRFEFWCQRAGGGIDLGALPGKGRQWKRLYCQRPEVRRSRQRGRSGK